MLKSEFLDKMVRVKNESEYRSYMCYALRRVFNPRSFWGIDCKVVKLYLKVINGKNILYTKPECNGRNSS